MLLEKTHALIKRNPPAPTTVRAEGQPTATVEVHQGPSEERQSEDPLETSLVEPSPQVVSPNPFEGEDEPVIRPTSGARSGAVPVLTETIHVESTTERPLEATGGAPKKSTRGKAPRKQPVPKRKRKTPGLGALSYVPKPKHIREARKAGFLYLDDPEKGRKNHFRASRLALNEIRHFQKRANLLICKLPFQCLVREISQGFNVDLRFQSASITAIQEACEATFSGSLRMKSYVLSMPRESQLCQRTSIWHTEFMVKCIGHSSSSSSSYNILALFMANQFLQKESNLIKLINACGPLSPFPNISATINSAS